MSPSQIIQTIRARVGPPPFAVVTRQQIRSAEAELGFPLPGMLVELYMRVGNGGFGPRGAHLVGIEGGAKGDIGLTLVDKHKALRSWTGFLYRYKDTTRSD